MTVPYTGITDGLLVYAARLTQNLSILTDLTNAEHFFFLIIIIIIIFYFFELCFVLWTGEEHYLNIATNPQRKKLSELHIGQNIAWFKGKIYLKKIIKGNLFVKIKLKKLIDCLFSRLIRGSQYINIVRTIVTFLCSMWEDAKTWTQFSGKDLHWPPERQEKEKSIYKN